MAAQCRVVCRQVYHVVCVLSRCVCTVAWHRCSVHCSECDCCIARAPAVPHHSLCNVPPPQTRAGAGGGYDGYDPLATTGSLGLGVAPGRGGQTQAMTVFPATYSLPTNVTKTAAKGALVSRHMLKVEPGEHMKTGQVRGLAPRLQLEGWVGCSLRDGCCAQAARA
jgi:hypothetical protein